MFTGCYLAELQELVSFTLKSYMSVWFTIKTSKHYTDGPKTVNQAIQFSRYLSIPLLDNVIPVIGLNDFFHPHRILTASLDTK